MDRGLITIETQARLRDAKQAQPQQQHMLPVSVSQGQITTYFLHEQLLRRNTADVTGASAGHSSSSTLLVPDANSLNGTSEALQQQHQQDLFTSKQAFMAELCQKVATEGFEPIQNVFSLPQW